MAPEMESPTQEQEIALAEFTDKPWNGAASKYGSTEAYCSACLIDENGSDQKVQAKCHLPIKEPGGAINKNALRNAAARLNQVQASSEAKATAKARLRNLMKAAGIETSLGEDLISEETDYIPKEEDSHGTVLSEIYERIKAALGLEDEPLEEAKEELEEEAKEEEVAYQLPVELSPTQKVGKRIWRKQLARLGQKIHHDDAPGGVLEYTKDYLQNIVDNYKGGAFYRVYATLRHSTDAEDCNGVARDLFVKMDGNPQTDGLYGDFELGPDAEKVVEANGGEIGSSVCLHHGHLRKADKKKFDGPSLQHVALVPRPYDPSLQPWEPVALSEETEVVDLTDAQLEAVETPRKEADAVSEVVVEPQEHKEEEVANKSMELSLEEMKRALELAQEEARDAKKSAGMTAQALAEQKVDRYLETMKREEGVPPFVAELARPLLLEAEVSPEEPSYDVVQLSQDGASKKPLSRGAIVRQLVESYKGTISLEEEGRADVEPDESDESAQQRRITQLAEEKFDGDTRKAAAALLRSGEVTI